MHPFDLDCGSLRSNFQVTCVANLRLGESDLMPDLVIIEFGASTRRAIVIAATQCSDLDRHHPSSNTPLPPAYPPSFFWGLHQRLEYI